MTEEERFELALERTQELGAESIGTQSERLLHRAVKYYLEPDEGCHEVPINGYVADIYRPREGRIFEIQTRDFKRLRKKLEAFLPDYRVTVVYPVLRSKYLCWIDPDTGELLSRRKSPRSGRATDVIPELYGLPGLFPHPHLDFLVLLLDGEEYRLKDGWGNDGRRGSHGVGKRPFRYAAAEAFSDAASLQRLLPDELSRAPFTAEALGKALKLAGTKRSYATTFLSRSGVIRRIDAPGRAYVYEITPQEEVSP